MNKRNSIIKMIYSNIFIIIISFIVISLAINLLVYKQLYNRAIVNGETLSVGVAMHIKDRLQESQRDIYEIENLLDSGLLNNTEINLFLNTIMKKDPIIQAIEVISLDGTVIHGAPDKYMSEGMDRSGEPFFMRTKTDGSIYWSRIMTLMLTGKPSITISNIVNNQMVVLYLDITKISEMAIGYSRFLPESTRLIITDESGVYITNNDKSMINQRAVSPEFNSIMKSISNQSYYFKSLSEDALVNVSYIDNARWYVALYNPITYIMSPIRNTNLLLYLLLGIILTALYVYYRKSKSLASSIAQFSKQTKEISEGNYSLILDDQIFKELHDLGESFELMNNKIKERDTILSDYAYNDSLTGLPNRRSMMELLHANVSAKEPFHVIYFDLDQFKNLNDSFGHYNGDLVLKQVAIRILTCTKDSGLIGRIGGDEFLLIIENKKDENYINSLIDKIFSELQKPYDLASSQIYIGISAGISIYPNDSDNVSDLLKYSDIAMYSAKSAGRNRFKYF